MTPPTTFEAAMARVAPVLEPDEAGAYWRLRFPDGSVWPTTLNVSAYVPPFAPFRPIAGGDWHIHAGQDYSWRIATLPADHPGMLALQAEEDLWVDTSTDLRHLLEEREGEATQAVDDDCLDLGSLSDVDLLSVILEAAQRLKDRHGHICRGIGIALRET